MAWVERNARNLGDLSPSSADEQARLRPRGKAGRGERRRAKEGALKKAGESDLSIVLRDGRAVHMGKGEARVRSLNRKHAPDGRTNKA